ncbi:hypothetical protein HPB47_000503, partial [Ixodes persulcatus]
MSPVSKLINHGEQSFVAESSPPPLPRARVRPPGEKFGKDASDVFEAGRKGGRPRTLAREARPARETPTRPPLAGCQLRSWSSYVSESPRCQLWSSGRTFASRVRLAAGTLIKGSLRSARFFRIAWSQFSSRAEACSRSVGADYGS